MNKDIYQIIAVTGLRPDRFGRNANQGLLLRSIEGNNTAWLNFYQTHLYCFTKANLGEFVRVKSDGSIVRVKKRVIK